MKELTHFIGGKQANGPSGCFCDGFEPMTGEVISRVPLASTAEVRAAIENAIAAQAAWTTTNPHRRARVLMKFLELVARAWPLKPSVVRRLHPLSRAPARSEAPLVSGMKTQHTATAAKATPIIA